MPTCLEWATERHEECVEWRDDGYEGCDAWDSRCCDWWPCSWACKVVTWFCVAWVWVSNLVCVAWNVITTTFCVVWDVVTTVINAILVGVFLDLLFAFGTLQPETAGMRVVILAGATISMALGIAIYVSGGLGEGPFEALMMVLHERGGVTVRTAKIALDVFAVAIGAWRGATVGVGTVVGAFGVGPITQLALAGISRLRLSMTTAVRPEAR